MSFNRSDSLHEQALAILKKANLSKDKYHSALRKSVINAENNSGIAYYVANIFVELNKATILNDTTMEAVVAASQDSSYISSAFAQMNKEAILTTKICFAIVKAGELAKWVASIFISLYEAKLLTSDNDEILNNILNDADCTMILENALYELSKAQALKADFFDTLTKAWHACSFLEEISGKKSRHLLGGMEFSTMFHQQKTVETKKVGEEKLIDNYSCLKP